MVLSYFKHHKNYILDVTEAQTSELFCNKKIDRILLCETIVVCAREVIIKPSAVLKVCTCKSNYSLTNLD